MCVCVSVCVCVCVCVQRVYQPGTSATDFTSSSDLYFSQLGFPRSSVPGYLVPSGFEHQQNPVEG